MSEWFWKILGGTVISLAFAALLALFSTLKSDIVSNNNQINEIKTLIGGHAESIITLKAVQQKIDERFGKVSDSRKDFEKEIRERMLIGEKDVGKLIQEMKEKLAALEEKVKGLEEKKK